MLKLKRFIIGMVLSLSLQTNEVTYCSSTPIGAIAERQDRERREREQMKQLNKLVNEFAKQGKTVEITTDKDVKLLIKRRKVVGEDKNKKISLPEAIAISVLAVLLALFPIFIQRFFDKE